MTPIARPAVRKSKRIVVKIGSGLLTREGRVRTRVFGDVALVMSVFADQSTGQIVLKLGEVRIIDPDAGNLVFPASP